MIMRQRFALFATAILHLLHLWLPLKVDHVNWLFQIVSGI